MTDTPQVPAHQREELWSFIEVENEEKARMDARKAAREEAALSVPADDEPPPDRAPKPPPEPPKKPSGGFWVRAGFYLSLLLVAVSGAMLLSDWLQERREEQLWNDLQNAQSQAEPEPEPAGSEGERTVLPRFAEALARNPDMVGWITLAGTEVDFPVMQGTDNSYYLTTNFDLAPSKYGTPFVDYRIDLSGQPQTQPDNLIIYGHNMGDGKMFGDFVRYGDPAFYADHPMIEVHSLYGATRYKVFAAFIANGETSNGYVFPYHMFLRFDGAETFDDYVDELRDRSAIDVDLAVDYGDKLLCISTCTYEFDGARYAVFARALREGESAGAAPAVRNPDPLYPAAFARLYGGRSDS